MSNYSKRATRALAKRPKFHTVMREYGQGELRSSSGERVRSPEQARAIAFSEARRARRRSSKR